MYVCIYIKKTLRVLSFTYYLRIAYARKETNAQNVFIVLI
jgi:hypothetical protein